MNNELIKIKKDIKTKEKELKQTNDLNEEWKITHELKDLYNQYYDLTGEVYS